MRARRHRDAFHCDAPTARFVAPERVLRLSEQHFVALGERVGALNAAFTPRLEGTDGEAATDLLVHEYFPALRAAIEAQLELFLAQISAHEM